MARTKTTTRKPPKKERQCQQCPATFTSRANYQRHLEQVHGDKMKAYQCTVCLKYSNRREGTMKHMLTQHGIEDPPHLEETMVFRAEFETNRMGAPAKKKSPQKDKSRAAKGSNLSDEESSDSDLSVASRTRHQSQEKEKASREPAISRVPEEIDLSSDDTLALDFVETDPADLFSSSDDEGALSIHDEPPAESGDSAIAGSSKGKPGKKTPAALPSKKTPAALPAKKPASRQPPDDDLQPLQADATAKAVGPHRKQSASPVKKPEGALSSPRKGGKARSSVSRSPKKSRKRGRSGSHSRSPKGRRRSRSRSPVRERRSRTRSPPRERKSRSPKRQRSRSPGARHREDAQPQRTPSVSSESDLPSTQKRPQLLDIDKFKLPSGRPARRDSRSSSGEYHSPLAQRLHRQLYQQQAGAPPIRQPHAETTVRHRPAGLIPSATITRPQLPDAAPYDFPLPVEGLPAGILTAPAVDLAPQQSRVHPATTSLPSRALRAGLLPAQRDKRLRCLRHDDPREGDAVRTGTGGDPVPDPEHRHHGRETP